MRVLLCAVLFLSMSSCAASWVTRMNDPEKGGVVKYLDTGADFVIEKRRDDAMKKMSDYCGGSYKILKESYDSNWTVYQTQISGNTATTTPVSSQYLHLYFRCS